MLTRIKVQGFKNIVDLDLRLGPLTCIAGPNAVGKSNIFDAILFLGALADITLLEAATGVRLETSRAKAGRIFSRGSGGVFQILREQRIRDRRDGITMVHSRVRMRSRRRRDGLRRFVGWATRQRVEETLGRLDSPR